MTTNRQKEIALAAIKLFEQKGYHATSVQDIADEVGIQKGSLYHYIHSKEDLLMQIAYEAIVEFNQNLEHILHTEETSRDKLIQAIENHLTVSVSNLETTTVLLREAFSLGDQTHKVIQDLTDKYVDLWTQLLQEGIDRGEFECPHPKIAALALLGACNWVYRWYKESGALSAAEIAGVFSHIFLNGLFKGKPKA
ncbi:MAG: TetR/AcrR family transcriptional regulator [Alicyclobacillus sp.]|nr:TetR/AcrR family transcriptional regulator [Alicyclobacillus sp.]